MENTPETTSPSTPAGEPEPAVASLCITWIRNHYQDFQTLDSLCEAMRGALATPVPAQAVPVARMLEFAEYMAKGAEQVMDALNALHAIREEKDQYYDGDEGNRAWESIRADEDAAEKNLSEQLRGLRSGIYEFQAQEVSVAPFGFIQPAEWGRHQSERTVKITRNPQLEYGFTFPLYAHPPAPAQAVPVPVAVSEGLSDVTDEMVSRFLCWRLPDDFSPDAGISFKRDYNEGTPWPMKHEPTGTNLLNYSQAKAMLRHVLATQPAGKPTGKYDDVLRPFFTIMEAELHANSSKGDRPGWLTMSREVALLEIYWHAAKLSAAVKNNDAALVREHSADVANMAMMLLDVCGGLTPAVAVEDIAPDAMAAHLNAINASPPEFDAFVNGKTPKWWQQEKFAIALAAFEFGRSLRSDGAAPLPLSDELEMALQVVEEALLSIVERRYIVGGTIEPVANIGAATKRAKYALSRLLAARAFGSVRGNHQEQAWPGNGASQDSQVQAESVSDRHTRLNRRRPND